MSLDEQVGKRLAELSDASAAEAEAFFSWNKERRAMRDKELEYEFQKYRSTMIREGVYSRQDVATLLSSFFTALQGTVLASYRFQYAGASEHLAQILADANAKGVSIEPPQIAGALGMASTGFLSKDPLKAKPKLAALEATTAEDGRVKADLEKAQRQNAKLNEKIARITAQFHEMMERKSEVGAELLKAKQEAKELREKHGGGPDPAQVAELQKAIEAAKGELESARRELAQKLNESPQYQNLKKMLAKKNEELDKLRKQLCEFELVYTENQAQDEVGVLQH